MSILETDYNRNQKQTSTQNPSLQPNLASTNSQSDAFSGEVSSSESAVYWSAIIAGTVVAGALSLALIVLGFGLGLSSISVWSNEGISATTLGVSTIIWLAVTHIIAHGMGGYLAGRLRTKFVSVHTDEVFFRDTAHGLLTWALATLLSAALITSAAGSIIGATASAGSNLMGGAATTALAGLGTMAANSNASNGNSSGMQSNPLNYLVNEMFRDDVDSAKQTANSSSSSQTSTEPNLENDMGSTSSDMPSITSEMPSTTSAADSNTTGGLTSKSTNSASNNIADVASIFANNMNAPTLPPKDLRYVGHLIAQQLGISQPEAEKRVAKSFASMKQKMMDVKQTTEKARKVAANTALWFFVFLLIGAFSASLAATLGGKWRDNQGAFN